MYRNIVYNNRTKSILLWTWDEDGNRVEREIPYNPYIHYEHKNGKDGISIYNTPLKKREFNSEYDRRKFVERSGLTRIFSNLPVEQQFLLDTYGDVDISKFTDNQIRIAFLDIECYSPKEFPKPDEARHPINLITIFDTMDNKYHTWGVGRYATMRDDVIYTECISEIDLLKQFMKYWISNYPDILTGWNSSAFDIPYLVNRMTNLIGESFAKRLSPTGRMHSIDKLDRFGRPIVEWSIQGISCIDYMLAYKKFSRNERESYKLDYIGQIECGVNKIEFNGSLADLSIKDWFTFVDYNIRDVEILVGLEKKLHFMELCRMLAYKGFTKYEKSLGTNAVVAGAFSLQCRKIGKIVPTFIYESGSRPPGGLVRDPIKGFHDSLVSFDAKSLYPSVIQSLNISPETKLGNSVRDENFTYVTTIRGKSFKVRNEEFKDWMIRNKVCRAVNGTLFSQQEQGIIPAIIETIYADRVHNKELKEKLEIECIDLDKTSIKYIENQVKIAEYDLMQYTLKILMNSIYGTFGNYHSITYDLDIVGAITLTGQESNLQAYKGVQEFVKKEWGVIDNLLIYGDTDSIYITIQPILDKLGVRLLESDERIEGKAPVVTKEAMDIIRKIGGEKSPSTGAITMYLDKWAREEMNSLNPQFIFEREKISRRGLFLDVKKRYALNVVDNEGIPVEVGSKKEFTFTGLEVVVSKYAKEIQGIFADVLSTMLISKDLITTNKKLEELYDYYTTLSPDVLAMRLSVNKFDEYAKKSVGLSTVKGTPFHCKASIYYNYLIKHLNIEGKYEEIHAGDKVKIIRLAKNGYGLPYVAFKDKLPDEFGFDIDYRLLYNKNVHPPIEKYYESVGWETPDPSRRFRCNLMELFG